MNAIDRIYENIERASKGSIELPVMPSTATVKSISGNTVKIKYRDDEDKKVPILQPNYKLEGVDAEGRTVLITMELNIKKGDRVFLAYLGGNYDSPIVIGKVP